MKHEKINLLLLTSATILFVASLVVGTAGPVAAAATDFRLISFGVKTNSAGTLVTDVGWGRGMSAKAWREGDWVPVKLTIENVQTDYPNLTGFPDIYIGWDYTGSWAESRFVDLVRDIQVGTDDLTDAQGWPQPDGTPYPTGPSPLPSLAAVHTAQTSAGQNIWTGFTDLQGVASVNYPLGPADSSLGTWPGTTTDDEHQFMVPAADIKAAVPATVDTIVIYFQVHLSRTFVWLNGLCEGYDTPPTDAWGGDLYGDPIYDTDSRPGSGFTAGSSGHAIVFMTGVGMITCQLPIPPVPVGEVTGLKWHDLNANHVMDGNETGLSGWRMHIANIDPEGLLFADSVLTGDTNDDGVVDDPESGAYPFPYLTEGIWYVSEDTDREDPAVTGWFETYPYTSGIVVAPVAWSAPVSSFPTGAQPAGVADWGWVVNLTDTNTVQGDVGFGNVEGIAPLEPECVDTATETGVACLTASHGTIEDLQAVPAPSPLPHGVRLPHGMFTFKITGLSPGQSVTLTVEFPDPIPTRFVWWKYHDNTWSRLPIGRTGDPRIITVTLTDGVYPGDEDSIAGQITDQGGPGSPGSVGWETYPADKVRVLLPWIVLAVILAGGTGWYILRRRMVQS